MVLMPVALLGGLGYRLARYERQGVETAFREVVRDQLVQIEQDIGKVLDQRKRDLLEALEYRPEDISAIRASNREIPAVSQLFYLDSQGDIIYPSPETELNEAEWAFLDRAKDVLSEKALQYREGTLITENAAEPSTEETLTQPEENPYSDDSQNYRSRGSANSVRQNSDARSQVQIEEQSDSQMQQAPRQEMQQQTFNAPAQMQQGRNRYQNVAFMSQVAETPNQAYGWYTWFWGKGVHIIFWRRDNGGAIRGAELNRIRLLSDIINILPDTKYEAAESINNRIVLKGALQDVIYQWGAYEPAEGESPFVSEVLPEPLSSWTLEYYLDRASAGLAGQAMSVYVNIFGGIAALLAAFLGLSFYFYREHSREMREARQRVSFVNQVSHELKTPLTNIRMYAELLQEDLDEEDERGQKYMGVVVDESRRLSRLIANILTFGRKQRKQLKIRKQKTVPDEAMRDIIEHYRACLENSGIELHTDLQAREEGWIDRDALEQIVGNLIGNAEKYAASGKRIDIFTRQEGDKAIIEIRDYGPGIEKSHRARIFEPFYRVSNRLTEGVSGTGIGLSIARDLARLHGGELELLASDQGAIFRITLDLSGPAHERKMSS